MIIQYPCYAMGFQSVSNCIHYKCADGLLDIEVDIPIYMG